MSDNKQISVKELESYFRSAPLPTEPFQLNPSHWVNDIRIFLESHFGPLRGKDLPLDHIDRPLYDRLVEFKNYLERDERDD